MRALPTSRFSRAMRTLVLGVLIVALFVAPDMALGAKTSVSSLQDQLDAVRSDLKKAGKAYDKAFWKLDETELRISKIDKQIDGTSAELERARGVLAGRVDGMYRADTIDYLSVVLGATSFDELVTRLEFVSRISRSDADAIAKVQSLQDKLERERADLEKQKASKTKAVSSLKKERDRLQKRLKSLQARYNDIVGKLDGARGGSGRSQPGPNGMVFPVRGVNYYSDTWGASRSGGRRRHQGTDIMAATGTPCVAVLSGTVTAKTSGLGGKTIWLTASNGWRFYYAHLSGWEVKSGHVSAGQVIGYVGSTGNARGGAPHLHFEIHPGGGGAVNPYPYLRRMQ